MSIINITLVIKHLVPSRFPINLSTIKKHFLLLLSYIFICRFLNIQV